MSAISLQARRQEMRQSRVERVLAVLEASKEFPRGLCEEEGTGDLVATPSDWAHFERIFKAFGLELPQSLPARNAIGAVVYLAGHLGSKIKLRASNERAYRMVCSTLTEAERGYVDALFGLDPHLAPKLLRELGVLEKLPSDFA